MNRKTKSVTEIMLPGYKEQKHQFWEYMISIISLMLFYIILLESTKLMAEEIGVTSDDGETPVVIDKPKSSVKRNTKNLLHMDFEQPTLDEMGIKRNGKIPVVTSERVFTGRQALKFYLNYNDKVTDESQPNYRTEAYIRNKINRYAQGEIAWVGFAIWVDKSFEEPLYNDIVMQWHSKPDKHDMQARNPSMTLSIAGNDWTFGGNGDSRDPLVDKKYQTGFGSKIGAVKKGSWTRFVINWKNSYNTDGYAKVWIDGKKVFDRSGIRTSFNDKVENYMKFGSYRWSWKEKHGDKFKRPTPPVRLTYVDSMRIALGKDRYQDVAP